jgi:hypothetical protein
MAKIWLRESGRLWEPTPIKLSHSTLAADVASFRGGSMNNGARLSFSALVAFSPFI